MIPAYIDATHLVTLLDRTEEGHRSAVFSFRLEMEIAPKLMSSNYDVVKAELELQRRHGIRGGCTLLEDVLPFLHIEWCTRSDHDAAVAAFLGQHPGSGAEPRDLVECVATQIVRRVGAESMR